MIIQVRTERGIIGVHDLQCPRDKAIAYGYSYSFTAYHCEYEGKVFMADVYSKCLDNRGLRHEFILVI